MTKNEQTIHTTYYNTYCRNTHIPDFYLAHAATSFAIIAVSLCIFTLIDTNVVWL